MINAIFKLFLNKIGIFYQSFIRSIFPILLVVFYKNKLNIGVFGEFIALTSLLIPFVSLGLFNIYIIDNKENEDNTKVLQYFIITLIICLVYSFIIPNKFEVNGILFAFFLSFSFIELMRTQNFIINNYNRNLILYESIGFAILISPILLKRDLLINDFIYSKIISIVTINSIFLIDVIFRTKQKLGINYRELKTSISYIPNKIISNSVEYILINSSLSLGQVFQNQYYYWRKIGSIPQFIFSLKNSILLKESYKNSGIKLLKERFSYMPFFVLLISTILIFINFELTAVLVHLSILDLCIGINYYNFLNKKVITLLIINAISLTILTLNYLTPNYFYYTLILYAITKFILSFYFEKFNSRKLVNN